MQMLSTFPADPDNHLCPASGDNCTTCSNRKHKPFCPDEKKTDDLGVEYGKCYVLETSNGRQIGRIRENGGAYEVPGFFTDLPFMVCDKDRECNETGPVHLKEPFALYDVVGHQDWDASQYSRRGFISRGQGREKITSIADETAIFAGTPSCLDGQYAIFLGGHGPGNVGIGPACPAERLGLNMIHPNPKIGMRLVFKRITCPDRVRHPICGRGCGTCG